MDDQNHRKPGDGVTNTFTLNLAGFQLDSAAAPNLGQTQPAGFASAPPQDHNLSDDLLSQTQTAASMGMAYGDPTMTDPTMTSADDTIAHMGFEPTLALPSQMQPIHDTSGSYHISEAGGFAVTGDGGSFRMHSRRKTLATATALTLVFVTVGFGGMTVFDAIDRGEDPMNHLLGTFGMADSGHTSNLMTRPKPNIVKAVEPSQLPSEQATNGAKGAGITPLNPYWSLPNRVPSKTDPDVRPWSMEERVIWKGGITHKYNYQHLKAINDVRQYQLEGSEEILWRGLNEPKLWSRMSAVMGLAEFGIAVDVDVVEQAIGNARPSLVKNYFKRFKRHRSAGELYIIRHAIKVVDAPARKEILEVIAQASDSLREVYLAAATFDPGAGIASFAFSQLTRLGVKRERYESLRNFITGTAELPADLSKETAETTPQEAITAQKVEEISTVEKIEFFGGVKSEPIGGEGFIEEPQKAGGVIEISDEDLL